MAQQASTRQIRHLIRMFRQFFLRFPCDCINGFGVGYKKVKGKATEDPALLIYVNKKLSLRNLLPENRIPKRIVIPDERGSIEVLTDVNVARFSSLEYINRERPVIGGISIGHIDITAGTLGCFVKSKSNGDVLILSNNHVMANSNDASIGDPILQPGPADGGTDPDDRIALLENFVHINFADGAENRVDGALAKPINLDEVKFGIIGDSFGENIPTEYRTITVDDLGLYVHKTGRTTEHTQGFIEAVNATVNVKYGLFKKATFVDQIIISQSPEEEDFSAGGDSGSTVYDSKNKLCGLLFAGSESTESEPATTIVNPISHVFSELDIELLTPGEI
jgi:hypothetical protein